MQRSFTRRQRRQLWIESGNRCACCGGALGVDWEADHVYPWSMGGETVLENAQALCRACNRRKGNTVIATNELRLWQKNASDQTLAAFHSPAYADRAFLAVATMGAGKTRYAADVARRAFASGMCRRVIVVVPTLNVITGWQEAMSMIGIELDDKWKGDRDLTSDFHGVIATYQSAIVDKGKSFAALADGTPTLLIADEVHHNGRDGAWGNSLERIGRACARRLFLTGTPIRSDNQPIPMVEYVEKTDRGRTFYEVVPDYTYEYRDALADEVVRKVRFHLVDSGVDFKVQRGEAEKDMLSYSLLDRMLPPDESARLIAALKPDENLMRQMISVGDERISELRGGGIIDAAGIVTCLDIGHAKDVAETVRLISGETPVLVHADDADARTKIDAFRASRKRWIVSIKMVSEGVDIPRLTVGVLATNVVATLFFKQFVGRCIRRRPGENVEAYIIAPKIPAFRESAKEFEDAVRHLVENVKERERDPGPPRERTYVTTHATMPHGTTIVANGVEVPAAFFDYARQLFPYAPPGEIFVAAYSMYATGASVPQISAPSPSPASREAKPETAASRLKRKKAERSDWVNRIIKITDRLFPENGRSGAMVNQNFMRAWGNRKVSELSIEQIEQQIKEAERIVRKMNRIEHEPAPIQRKQLGDLLSGMRGADGPLSYRHPGDAVADPVAERARALGTEGSGGQPVP